MGLLGDFFSRGFDDEKKAAFEASLEESYEEEKRKNSTTKSVWQCTYCGLVAYSLGKPEAYSVEECSLKLAGQSPKHNWEELGKKGEERYCCPNCGVVIYTEREPNFGKGNCDPGYAIHVFHAWQWSR